MKKPCIYAMGLGLNKMNPIDKAKYNLTWL